MLGFHDLMMIKYLLLFSLYIFSFPCLAVMGRFGGWSNFSKSGEASYEQRRNAMFDDMPENSDVNSKPRASLSEQSSKNSGILYTAEDKYKLPPVKFDKVYSDVESDTDKKFKIKPVNPIQGLNIIETGTYLAN